MLKGGGQVREVARSLWRKCHDDAWSGLRPGLLPTHRATADFAVRIEPERDRDTAVDSPQLPGELALATTQPLRG